jgi:uncharacterized protein YcbX
MQIESLWRYPVKGLSAENLPFVDLAGSCGFPWDRVYAVTDGSFAFDPAQPQPMPKTHFLMLAKYKKLALLRTKLNSHTQTLLVEGAGASRRFQLNQVEDRQALAAFLSDFLDTTLRGQPVVVQAPGHQFTDVSVHSTALMRSISLINLATVRDLERHLGRKLDPLRFRANVYFDGAEAWSELDWVGRTLHCGDVVLNVVRRTSRCPATSVDLVDGTRDLNMPLAIRDYRGHGDCGVYAEVVDPGRLQQGDPLALADLA